MGTQAPSAGKQNQRKKIIIAAVAFFTLLIIVIATLFLARSQRPGQTGEQAQTSSASAGQTNAARPDGEKQAAPPVSQDQKRVIDSLARKDPHDPHTKGKTDAKIVVKVYADFRCIHCAVYTLNTEPQLKARIDNGDIRYEFENFPVLGQESVLAAQGAEAAALQNKFWEYHDALFNGLQTKSITYTPEGLTQLAEKVGIPDTAKFRADLTSPAVTEAVRKSAQTAQKIGLQGTPGFIIGYYGINAGIEISEMNRIIDAQIAAKAK